MPRIQCLVKGCALAVVLLFLASPVLSRRLHPGDYEGGRSRDASDRSQRNTSSAAVMLGELRTAMSDIVFIKTERYLDSGVAYMPHVESDELMTVAGADPETEGRAEGSFKGVAHAEGHGHEHDNHDHDTCDYAGTPTMVPTAADDFRGLIGRLHRAVKPWRDPSMGHQHSDGRELLPWFRVMTVSDPNSVRGYGLGAWWLGTHDREAALTFIAEGIENNGDAFQLHYTQGSLLAGKARGLADRGDEGAAAAYRAALSSYKTALELALAEWAQVEPDDPASSGWTDYMENDAWAAARLSVVLEQRYGSEDEAVRLARRCSDLLGADPTFDRILAPPAGG